MKKLFVHVSCFAVVLILSKMSFAQFEGAPGHAHSQPQLSFEKIVADAYAPVVVPHPPVIAHAPAPSVPGEPHALPFGYPPYPTTAEGHPVYGIPYSYPQQPPAPRLGQRRLLSRLTPPPPQPYPMPTPGAMPGPTVLPSAPPMVAPPMTFGQVPPQHGMINPYPAPPGPPVVVHRPTPLKNFRTLLFAPRPYIGYDPYAGYPPFPGYQPPQ